jgi:hypothetical protein
MASRVTVRPAQDGTAGNAWNLRSFVTNRGPIGALHQRRLRFAHET